MALVYVPFSESEMFDGDCLLTGEFAVDVVEADDVRDKVAKHYLDETADYEEFVEEFSTTIDGVWVIKKSVHQSIIKSMPNCGNDTIVYAAIHIMKSMIANMAVDTIHYAKTGLHKRQ